MDNCNNVLYLLVQNVINLNYDNLLTLGDMILISRINKFQHKRVNECFPLFINLLGWHLIPKDEYFRKYYRGKTYRDDNSRGRGSGREIDEPFTLNSNERVLTMDGIDVGFDNDSYIKMEAIKDFMEIIATDKRTTVVNERYTYHLDNGSGILFMITNSGKCHIFYDECGVHECTPDYYGYDSLDINKEVLAMTVNCENISAVLNLLYQYGLGFLLKQVKHEYILYPNVW